MANIALNKSADASNYVYPYVPSKAVDGGSTPLGRWLGSSPIPVSGTPSPVWLRVDLGAFSWINRWVVKQMGSVGWNANYNLTDYKLQGSIDNANWFDIDSVTNNSANQTDRAFTPTKVRWARIYVTKGLRCNTNFASIVDLELYPADPTSAKLTSLVLSAGTLAPPFASATYAYTANVGYDNSTITLTPTAEDSRATIKVNGTPVTSGQASEVSLQVGENTVIVQVTPFIGDPQNYTITVTRASSPYLTNVIGTFENLNPSFNRNVFIYNASVSNGTTSIKITPTAEDPDATITVNGTVVQSGKKSQAIPINIGDNIINVIVTSVVGNAQMTYTFTVSRQL